MSFPAMRWKCKHVLAEKSTPFNNQFSNQLEDSS